MLSVIRRFIHSKVGLFITFALLAVIALAFVLGDVNGLSGGSSALNGDAVATIGKQTISEIDLRARAEEDLNTYRQQQPSLDMAQFVAGGGLDAGLQQMIEGQALEQFGLGQGMVVSKRSIDGQLASIPNFQGVNGQFNQQVYQQFLAQNKFTDQQFRTDVARKTVARQLVFPIAREFIVPGARLAPVPVQYALPYASLLLEKRAGQIAFIPTRAMGEGTPPTDAELAAWYKRNVARYTVPERRVIRYAIVTADQIKAQTVPSESEIAEAYKGQAAKFAPSEKRKLVQVTLVDQAAAAAFAAKIKAGTAIESAARAAGLEPLVLDTDKAGYAAQSTAALADAAFAAPSGALIGPMRGTIGFAVVRVAAIEQVPGKTLEQARPELVTALTATKTNEVLGKIHDAIDDAISARATFAEIVADQKLRAEATPALLADGRDPDDATRKAAPDFMPVVAAAFAAAPGDAPQMVPVDKTGGFALVALDRTVAPLVPPLKSVRADLARDFTIDRARRAARALAADIVAKSARGGSLPDLVKASGIKAPPVQPLAAMRAQLAANPRGAPPPLALLFSMMQGASKLLEAPNNEGWFVIRLDRIDRGNAAGNKTVIDAMRGDLGKAFGREYVDQFTAAISAQVGVKKDEKHIAKVKAALLGQGGAQ